jgi:aspartyl-tRNA(Asn)/glutamyl-tRNA(Gln) amidotransferase subunit A
MTNPVTPPKPSTATASSANAAPASNATRSAAPATGSIADLVAAMSSRRGLSRLLIEQAREAAHRHESLNAIAHVDWQQALDAADALDRDAAAGRLRGPLHGIPVSLKDLYAVEGMPMAGGTRARLPQVPHEATLVSRLRAAGALPFAKTNMHEIALGATGENAWTGDVCNPQDPARQAGGSSSGSGVAVATGIGIATVGSDTGGSVRIPAAFCGIVGFKPSFGAIPLDGALPLSWTCDHPGPLTRSIDDAVLMFEAMSGRSVRHGGVARRPRLAVPSDWLAGRLSPSMRAWFDAVRAALAARADLVDVPTPLMAGSIGPYTTIVRAEAAYIHREALAAGGEGFSDLVLPPLRAGVAIRAQDYLAAMAHRDSVRRELDAILAGCDALVAPTTAVAPPLRGQLEVDVEGGGRLTVREAVLGQTLPFSYVGLPALAMPWGRVDGLRGSLQVVGRRDGDASLLALGRWLEGLAMPFDQA